LKPGLRKRSLKLHLALFGSLALASGGAALGADYQPRGVGGGGAMAAFSISPYAKLRFVGTDMGTLFRSTDGGARWIPISHAQITFGKDLTYAGYVGFSSDKKTVFYAPTGRNPKRSTDAGVTWKPMELPLNKDEHVRYWSSDTRDPDLILCATDLGLLKTTDKGAHWKRVESISGPSTGTAIVYDGGKRVVLHATDRAIFSSRDGAASFWPWFTPIKTGIRAFAAGLDAGGFTAAVIDLNGAEACSWAKDQNTFNDCGYIWIHKSASVDKPAFNRTSKEAGRFIRMAENDSRTIYATAGNWIKGYGTKVWVSPDSGASWELRLHMLDFDKIPYRVWPSDKLEYSAVGLDIAYDDNAYFSFNVNPANSSEAGGTGHYFLHTTSDKGAHWKAPFTKYEDTGEREKGKRWSSTGLEVTSVLRLKFHPSDPKIGYAAMSDVGGYATEDGGATWRIARAQYNTNYDYAFDPADKNVVYAASGSVHDYPLGQTAVTTSRGGIYRSGDRGRTWKRLTREMGLFDRQFLSVAYDPIHKILYGGTQGGGVARSKDGGQNWEYFNPGLPDCDLIIPQIEIDPKNGDPYILVSGDKPKFSNQQDTGIYALENDRWKLLRDHVLRPPKVDAQYKLWWYPSAFAVDFSRPQRDVLWLVDMEDHGAWLATGIWKSTNRGLVWERVSQYTHPSSITLDPKHPGTAYVGGLWQLDGTWGEGGPLYTTDGGRTWKKNKALPFLSNASGAVPDPNHPEKVFYLFFGGGMLYGPKPN
jgi:photosystem II stability/assembly factor-like uncharacterized protein